MFKSKFKNKNTNKTVAHFFGFSSTLPSNQPGSGGEHAKRRVAVSPVSQWPVSPVAAISMSEKDVFVAGSADYVHQGSCTPLCMCKI